MFSLFPTILYNTYLTLISFSFIYSKQHFNSNQSPYLYALGDLHGDFNSTVKILQHVQLINTDLNWGDIVDRGHDTFLLYSLFEKLHKQAIKTNGRVVNIIGNHEVMNLQGDYRYVSEKDVNSFGSVENRKKQFSREGKIGSFIRNVFKAAEIINGVLFVHAGYFLFYFSLTKEYAILGIQKVNHITRNLIKESEFNNKIFNEEGPFWYRGYALGDTQDMCFNLKEALSLVNAHAMVVGHTIQQNLRINSKCNNALYLIDTAISSAYGGDLSILRFELNNTRKTKAIYPVKEEYYDDGQDLNQDEL